MFINYKKEIQNNSFGRKIIVPDTLIEQLNKGLPEGLFYEKNENGLLSIAPDSIHSIEGLKPQLTKEQKAILGDNPSEEALSFFMYNSQQKIKMVPIESNHLLLNGKKITLDELIIHPYKGYITEKGFIYRIPKEFPPSISIELSSKQYHRIVKFKRVPNLSLTSIKFRSEECETLDFQIEHDLKNNTISFSINTRMNNVQTVSDIVETIAIYNAFHDGEGLFAGEKLESKFLNPKESPYTNQIVEFWEKVLKIESVLKIKFTPTLDPINYLTVCNVERIYQGVIMNTPFLSKEIINSVTRDGNNVDDIEEFVGKSSYFEFDSIVSYDLLETKITLPALVGMFNTKISHYTNRNNSQIVFFDDADESAKRFCVVKVFADDNSRKQYKNCNHKEIMEAFSNAKYIEEYIKKN